MNFDFVFLSNYLLFLQYESRKLTRALGSCFVLFATLRQGHTNGAWWEPHSQSPSLENDVSNRLHHEWPFSNWSFNFANQQWSVNYPPLSCILLPYKGHCWRVPNRTKKLSSCPASFPILTLIVNDEFLIKNSDKIPYYLWNNC